MPQECIATTTRDKSSSRDAADATFYYDMRLESDNIRVVIKFIFIEKEFLSPRQVFTADRELAEETHPFSHGVTIHVSALKELVQLVRQVCPSNGFPCLLDRKLDHVERMDWKVHRLTDRLTD